MVKERKIHLKTMRIVALLCGLLMTSLSSLHAMEPPKPSRDADQEDLVESLDHKIRSAVKATDARSGYRLADVQSIRYYPFSIIQKYDEIHKERVRLAQRAVNAYWDLEFEEYDEVVLQLVVDLTDLYEEIKAGKNIDESKYFADPLLAQTFLIFCKPDGENFYEARRMIFSWAIRHGYNDTLAVALANGANPDSRDGRGQTALHRVARTGNVVAARMLLDYGAQWDAKRSSGETPLDVARIHGDGCPIARLLLSHGAAIRALGPQ